MRGNLFCKKRFPRTPSKKLSQKRSKREVISSRIDGWRVGTTRFGCRKQLGTTKTLCAKKVGDKR